MALASGRHEVGPDSGSLLVKTYREGAAARVGHDLVIEVTDWSAEVVLADDPAQSSLSLRADPRSVEVREGVGGVKPLSDKDRADIRKTIAKKVLGSEEISFRSRRVEVAGAGGRMTVEGDLSVAGSTRPVTAELDAGDEGRVSGTIPLTQSEWGIEPYRGLMGALRVRDVVEVVLDVRLA